MVTTGRSRISSEYIDYIFNQQGVIKLMFGLNPLIRIPSGHVPHNTYLDFILQFGLLGSAVLLWFIVRNLSKSFRPIVDKPSNKPVLILKVLFLFYMFGLSLYEGCLTGIMIITLFAL